MIFELKCYCVERTKSISDHNGNRNAETSIPFPGRGPAASAIVDEFYQLLEAAGRVYYEVQDAAAGHQVLAVWPLLAPLL